ncbi:MAG: hypothetical protein JKX91_02610 [Rhizobiaceae bacterium]|nr:hypothetical protein [Rhizobiaceae bacterium]
MLKRLLNLATASILLLAISACVSSKEPLPLKNPVRFLPASALLHFDDDGKAELYKLVYNKGTYTVFEKGKSDPPYSVTFYKTPGLPKGYHIGWRPWAKGTKHEHNYYNFVWLEKPSSGQQQVVMFWFGDEDKNAIIKELNIDPEGNTKIDTTQEIITYAKALFKRDKNLDKARFDVYDLSDKDDFIGAEALAGAAFLAAKTD